MIIRISCKQIISGTVGILGRDVWRFRAACSLCSWKILSDDLTNYRLVLCVPIITSKLSKFYAISCNWLLVYAKCGTQLGKACVKQKMRSVPLIRARNCEMSRKTEFYFLVYNFDSAVVNFSAVSCNFQGRQELLKNISFWWGQMTLLRTRKKVHFL